MIKKIHKNETLKLAKLVSPIRTVPQSKRKECKECENHEWLWSNGRNYCPYCQKQISL